MSFRVNLSLVYPKESLALFPACGRVVGVLHNANQTPSMKNLAITGTHCASQHKVLFLGILAASQSGAKGKRN